MVLPIDVNQFNHMGDSHHIRVDGCVKLVSLNQDTKLVVDHLALEATHFGLGCFGAFRLDW